jgi:predicted RNA-binding Zn-ribbon protein involved in translation (DUF1610 family)
MELEENIFKTDCPHCGKTNMVRVQRRKTSVNEWVSYQCAYCGLTIDETKAAGTPETKKEDDNTPWAETT